jgi:hypothetical protein
VARMQARLEDWFDRVGADRRTTAEAAAVA